MSPKPKSAPHRVLLSLPTDLYKSVSRLAKAMDKPRAEVIRELLAEQQALLDIMAQALEQAKKGQKAGAMKSIQRMAGMSLRQLGDIISPEEAGKDKSE